MGERTARVMTRGQILEKGRFVKVRMIRISIGTVAGTENDMSSLVGNQILSQMVSKLGDSIFLSLATGLLML